MLHVVYFDNPKEDKIISFLYDIYNLRSFLTGSFRDFYSGRLFTFCQLFLIDKFTLDTAAHSYGTRLRFESCLKMSKDWYLQYEKYLETVDLLYYTKNLFIQNNVTPNVDSIIVCLDINEVNFLKQNFECITYCDYRFSQKELEYFTPDFDFCVNRNIIKEILKNVI